MAEAQVDSRPPGPAPCPGTTETPPAFTGTVRDDRTGLPLPGAAVLVSRSPPGDTTSVRIPTDSAGTYRVCGTRPGDDLRLRATLSGRERRDTAVPVTVPADGRRPAARDLRLHLGRPGTVRGRVSDAVDGRPVRAATVLLPALGVSVVSSDQGRFRLPSLPSGRWEIRVRHVGHGVHSDSVDVRPGARIHLSLRLTRDPVEVAPLNVEVESVRSLWLDRVGFYDRRRRGHGTYVTRRQLEEWGTSELSQAFRRIQGFRLKGPSVRRYVHSNRDGRSFDRGGACQTQFFVNGEAQPLPNGIDSFLPADVAALEIYRGTASLPAEFNRRSASCGAVVIWLRSELDREGR